MPPRPADGLGFAGSSRTILTIAALVAAGGAAACAARVVGASPAESTAEKLAGGLALGGLVAAPGLLAALALRDRPALLLPAATILIPLSLLSFAGVLLPLLIPSILLFVAYGRRSALQATSTLRTTASLGWALALLVAAGVSLFVHQDPRSYATPLEEGSTSDVITPVEAAVSLALVAAGVFGAWRLSEPDPAPARSTPAPAITPPG
jgi:hypothetical protein